MPSHQIVTGTGPIKLRDKCCLCGIGSFFCSIFFYLAGVIGIMIINFVGTVSLFVLVGDSGRTGWSELENNCSTTLRNTMLSTIILQFIIVIIALMLFIKSERYTLLILLFIVPFTIIGSILVYSDLNASDACNRYLKTQTPGNVFVYQITTCWSSTIVGIVCAFWRCCKCCKLSQ